MKENSQILKFGSENFEKEFILNQIKLSEYETFDDYLEIVIEFGYLVLFGECFPYASIIIIIFSIIEMRIDIFKLGTFYKKPHFFKKRNIGSWGLILKILSVMSVFTNTLLFLISLNQNENLGSKGNIFGNLIKNQKEKYSNLIMFFMIEHVVLVIFFLLNIIYKSKPYWVEVFFQRRDFKLKGNRWIAIIEGTEENKK